MNFLNLKMYHQAFKYSKNYDKLAKYQLNLNNDVKNCQKKKNIVRPSLIVVQFVTKVIR